MYFGFILRRLFNEQQIHGFLLYFVVFEVFFLDDLAQFDDFVLKLLDHFS